MPPEPLPLDRKDSFKEKKHEKPDPVASSAARWRDARRPPGLCKQGSSQVFSEESGHGCTTSRSCDSGRPSARGVEGRYGMENSIWLENQTVFGSNRDCKGHQQQHLNPWESGGIDMVQGSSGDGRQQQHDVGTSGQRSIDDLVVTHTPQALSDVEKSPFDESFKDQHDKLGIVVDGSGTGHIYDNDNSLGSISWKTLKWTRSGSLSTRTSGFAPSTGSKGIKADSDDARVELLAGKETTVPSHPADAAEGVSSVALVEGTCQRKKPRLGWGQGLAKYEKEKVEGPEDIACRNGLAHGASNAKIVHNTSTLSLPDKSPKAVSVSECTSPTTPCSVACSSSSGLEDRPHIKDTNNDNDTSHYNNSPGQGFQKCPEELSANMEHLELNPISKISSLLVDLLSSQDASSGDSDYVQSTALKKLLLLKTNILKSLEKTECDIDLFENELKSLDFESETNAPYLAASQSVQTVLKPCKEQADSAPYLSVREQLPCNDPLEEVANDPLEVQAEVKDEDIDSPGTVTSKCSELPSMELGVSALDRMKLDEYAGDFEAANSMAPRGQCSVPFISMERSEALCDGEDGTFLNESSAGAHVSSAVSLYGESDSSLSSLIFASNKELARKALEAFDKASPPNLPQFDIRGIDNGLSCRKSDLRIKEKLVMNKHFQKFKERVLTLKFRVLHHFWKEDIRLLSLRKNRAKSQKRFEVNCRYSNSGYQKHRTSVRSRFTSPGNLTLVPTTETIDFTSSKLLADSQIKQYRNSLKMPALILDDLRHSRFTTNNGLVEDPCAVEKERTMTNPWMPDEKEVFLEKLATFGKDFRKIASFLVHKTTADCVEFYYKNHKSESFEKVKKRLELRKQLRCFPTNTYLIPSGKKWNRDVNAASLGVLGAASAVASHAGDSKARQMYTGVPLSGCYYDCKASIKNDGVFERSCSAEIPGNESEAAAAGVLASICGGLSSEAMSSCITSSVDPGEGCQEWRGQNAKSMVMERPFTPEVSQNIDEEDTFSDDSCGELESADWTDEEKSSFIMALRTYGKDFASISKCTRTRSRDQCKIFFSKARNCLGLDLIHQEPYNERTRMSDASGGRSDTEDACVVEIDSAICSMQSCSKIDVDLPPSLPNKFEGSGNSENNLMHIELGGSTEKVEAGGSNPEVDTGIKKLDLSVDQSGIKRGWAFGGDNRSFKEDESQSGKVPEVLQMDGATVDAVLGYSNLPVTLLDDADSFVETDWKIQATDQAKSCVQLNSACTEVPLELGQSTPHVVDEPKQAVQSQCRPYVGVEPRQEVKPISYDGLLEPKSESPELLVPETAPVTGLDGNSCSTSSRDLPYSNANRNSSCHEVEGDACPIVTSSADHQHQSSLELPPSPQKSQVTSWKQENCPYGLANSSQIDHYDTRPQGTQSVPNLEEQVNKQHQISESLDFYKYLPLQVLRGYPLRLLNKKEISKHADLISEKPVQKLSKINRDCRSNLSIVLEKCDGSKSPVSVSELSFLPKSCERSEDLLRSGSQGLEKQIVGSCFETEEQSVRTGDVKLFGQILSHLSPLQKVSSSQEKNDKATSPKSSQSFSFKFSEQGPHGALVGSKLEASSNMGRQEFPVTSFGVWDGNNRIHNGLPLLSGSAMLSAINNYPVPTCQLEPQPLSAVLRRNDRVLGRVLGYPTKDVSGNGGLANHQVYQSYEGSNVKPFSMDVKLQDHNGFETLLGFQQQGNAVVGMGGVGGGIVVGGCTGVSDPVAALKKHFANEARSSGRSDESWSGDVGR